MFGYCSLPLLLSALLCTPTQAETLTGTIRVVDGDTIELSSPQNIRLVGIDAPEMAQQCRDAAGEVFACGVAARDVARQAYEGLEGRCEVEGRDRNGRPLAVCRAGGHDMNAELVRLGLARIYRANMRYEDDRYAAEQAEAVRARRGFWAGEMQDPSVWRAENPTGPSTRRPPVPGCDIKGNISENGRIYHLPDSRSYAPTRIDVTRGERWFCSEAAARAAGWSRAGS